MFNSLIKKYHQVLTFIVFSLIFGFCCLFLGLKILKMKFYLISIFLLVLGIMNAQNAFIGTYEGIFNGDNISLILMSDGGDKIFGTMQDSQNKYVVSGDVFKNDFVGQAVEASLGITFSMTGVLIGNVFNTILTFEYLGEKHAMKVALNKKDSANQNNMPNESIKIPNKPRDGNVVGIWVKENNYSSGYSSNGSYGAMNTRESMIFYADGSMADGGSASVVGGSNFSGSSSAAGSGVVPGLYWWTENSKIFLHITEGEKHQQLELGRYFIENGRMLITSTNGEKILLTKQ